MFERDSYEEQPIHSAAASGDDALVRQLIEANSDPNCRNPAGDIPLNMAVEAGSAATVQALLELGADPNQVHEARGHGPGHIAARKGYADVLTLLLQYGADPESKNSWGDSVRKVARKSLKEGKSGSEEVAAALAAFSQG
eukprot:TRINITY_DN6991_c0_g1_i1.p1 TRINITY_DN6991_c0_g1~~TRINITY_DN6991_c0_g1_i1.p1  ORF type:complete len:154 (+),score=29.18 TRINITY_DN6991_c0_g1_i1:44-463(+)